MIFKSLDQGETMKKFTPVWAILFLSLTLVSCSESSGGGSEPAPQEEQDTGGTTGETTGGTTGGSTGGTTSGTSGGTTGGGSACINTNDEKNIRSVLDTLFAFANIQGNFVISFKEEDETTTTFEAAGGYSFTKENQNKWIADWGYCTEMECADFLSGFEIQANGCFYYGSTKTRIVSTSSTRITYRTRVDGTDVQTSISIPSGNNVEITEVTRQNGDIIRNEKFLSL